MDESDRSPGTSRSSQRPWLEAARQSGVLSRLTDAQVEALIRGGQRVTYAARSIVPDWDEVPWAAIVLRGCVRAYLPSLEGGQITLRYLRTGDIMGTFEGVGPGLARSFQVLEGCELLRLDVGRMTALARKEPAVTWEFLQESIRISRQAHRSFLIRSYGSVRTRVASALLERARACTASSEEGTVLNGTQHELANAAGTVREVVATALQALKRDGIIQIRRGAVVILDPARLAEEARSGLGLALQ
jgi:CRP/FNR family transcriptional regulator, cyclic AMP receptor protein